MQVLRIAERLQRRRLGQLRRELDLLVKLVPEELRKKHADKASTHKVPSPASLEQAAKTPGWHPRSKAIPQRTGAADGARLGMRQLVPGGPLAPPLEPPEAPAPEPAEAPAPVPVESPAPAALGTRLARRSAGRSAGQPSGRPEEADRTGGRGRRGRRPRGGGRPLRRRLLRRPRTKATP